MATSPATVESESMDVFYSKLSEVFHIHKFNVHQRKAIDGVILEKKDVFVNLPTGSGKSLVFQAMPLMVDLVKKKVNYSIVVVVSPLINLMLDQVNKLNALGITSVCLSEVEDVASVEAGKFAVVYGTPESWLKNERWRSMLTSKVYKERVCAIAVDEAHVVKQWGTSMNNKYTAFREVYSSLHELTSLIPAVNMLALTATATQDTMDCIMETLLIVNPIMVKEAPNKKNIMYSATYMDKTSKPEDYFGWIADDIKEKGSSADRVIIYCQTIQQCGIVYALLKGLLGESLYAGPERNPKNVVLEMLHSCTPKANKDVILNSFQHADGCIRVLVATIAFGMGVDCKGVHTSIHFGPPKNLEAYMQESGRAGRDGQPSKSFILYKGLLLAHVEQDIKKYLNEKGCRRNKLMHHFGITTDKIDYPGPRHECCDNCAKSCTCRSVECESYCPFPGINAVGKKPIDITETREVTTQNKCLLEKHLIKYHKTLLMSIIAKQANGQLSSIIHPQMLIGFGDVQIAQVLDNCQSIKTIADVYKFVEIWHSNHANYIYQLICKVFLEDHVLDSIPNIYLEFDDSDDELDDLVMNEWATLVEDDELFNMVVENISLSQIYEDDTSIHELSSSDSTQQGLIPTSAMQALANLSITEDDEGII